MKNKKSGEDNKSLKQHSALVTFTTKQEYFNIDTEKSIFVILTDTQIELQKLFIDIYKPYLRKIFNSSEEIDKLLKVAYVPNAIQKLDLDFSKVNIKEIPKLKEETIRKKIEASHSMLIDKEKKEKYLLDIEGIDMKKLTYNGESKLTYTKEEIIELLESVKDICEYETLNRFGRTKIIDFTDFAKKLGINSKRLKENLIKAMNVQLNFNYIDKKNLKIESMSNLISSIAFIPKKRITWMSYQIPDEILKHMLMPKMYVYLQEKNIKRLTGKYSIRLYSFLKDHITLGEVTITKEECKGFFQLPESYLKNKQHLVNRFLIPTIADIKVKTGMEIEYELIPNYNFREIKFTMKQGILKEEIIEEDIVTRDAFKQVEIDETLIKAVTKAKRNIYVNKAWNKYFDNKLLSIIKTEGTDYACELLNDLYNNLKEEVQTTLVQYVNGIIKNKKQEAKLKTKTKVKKEINKELQNVINTETIKTNTENKEITLYDICKKENRIQSQERYIVSIEEYKKEIERYISNGLTKQMADVILNKIFIIKDGE